MEVVCHCLVSSVVFVGKIFTFGSSFILLLSADLITSTAPPQSTGAVQDTTPRMQAFTSCRACSIITRDEIGFVSHDFSAKTDYVSTQFPSDVDLLKAVRTACMRSLSCEVRFEFLFFLLCYLSSSYFVGWRSLYRSFRVAKVLCISAMI